MCFADIPRQFSCGDRGRAVASVAGSGEDVGMQSPPYAAICLVTGASSGIGLALVHQLLERGHRVVCIARDRARLESALVDCGEQVYLASVDVTDQASVDRLVVELPAQWQPIEILVANAGSDIGGRVEFVDGNMADWADTIATNVSGVMRICHAFLPSMIERNLGHVVTIGSTAGVNVYVGGAAYAASKYAVRAFTEALRLELKRSPIRITEVLPGTARTGFAAARHRGDSDRAANFYEQLDGTLDAKDVVAAVMYALDQPPHVNIAQILITPTSDK
jgi:3-hydroxy acid dehydrogenase/malonic semialdehyde reductase